MAHAHNPSSTQRSPTRLYGGIDVGKYKNSIAFHLVKNGRHSIPPAFTFPTSRDGFEKLLKVITADVSIDQCHIVLEETGHYSKLLEDFLRKAGVQIYHVHPQKRGLNKSDEKDAHNMASMIYNQVGLGAQIIDNESRVRLVLPVTEASAQLVALFSQRETLVKEVTRLENRLTALTDELFPELRDIFRDIQCKTALALRNKFPTPKAIADAPFEELEKLFRQGHISNKHKQIIALQEAARSSIGITEGARYQSLIVVQDQSIALLQQMKEYIDELNDQIRTGIAHSREGKILMSIPGIGPIQAAGLLVAIGNINEFPSVAALKCYCGYAPKQSQSGSLLNKTTPAHIGNRTAKRLVLLAAMRVVQQKDTEFAKLYEKLIPKKCTYDERQKRYKGKLKVIVRVAQRMLSVVYALLKQDQALIEFNPTVLPEPKLYDAELHHRHRHGAYRPTHSYTQSGT